MTPGFYDNVRRAMDFLAACWSGIWDIIQGQTQNRWILVILFMPVLIGMISVAVTLAVKALSKSSFDKEVER